MKSLLAVLSLAAMAVAQDAPEVAPAKAVQSPPPVPYDSARPLIVSKYGIVSASNYLASLAGAKVLEQGGNAIDAAIAANAMTGLTQPFVNGIGGDLFAIIYEAKTGKVYGLNASGWTPKALNPEWLKSKGITKIDPIGVHAITVPGAVAGWEALRKRFGSKTLSEILAPAILHAEQGFPVSVVTARSLVNPRLMKQPGFKETYLAAGEKPTPGDTFKNPALGESLRMLGNKGRDGYYTGKMAETLVEFLNKQGGAHTLADFAEYQPEWVEPISTTYRGWKIFELPPNGQGVAALSMLNIMERFPIADYGHNSAAAMHVMIEAKKLAYADMAKYVGDPRFGAVPVNEMLSKELAERRAGLIRMDKAACAVLPSEISQNLNSKGRETIYLSAIDKEGNIVSLIQSNYAGYGTGMVAPGTGFSLHNRGAGFELAAGKPNSLEGRKRPLHTIIPAFMEKGDQKIGFGIMGGWNQSQAHAQFVANVVDFKMNVQQAIEAARFTKSTFEGCDVQIEGRVPEGTRSELTRRGHAITVVPNYSMGMGFGSAVQRDTKRNVNFSGTDPRVDGAAIPESPSFKP
ncbi:MAG: gamma-glutamyltransferase [Acidobacteria bacterium]|nr:gamma-glutamyltransferase [Acidobacteriota bacterium]